MAAGTGLRKNSGKCLTSYVYGAPDLFQWLDQNPIEEFQPVDKFFEPIRIGRNPRFVAIVPARKVDFTDRIQLITGKGNVSSGSAEVMEFFMGARLRNIRAISAKAAPSRTL